MTNTKTIKIGEEKINVNDDVYELITNEKAREQFMLDFFTDGMSKEEKELFMKITNEE